MSEIKFTDTYEGGKEYFTELSGGDVIDLEGIQDSEVSYLGLKLQIYNTGDRFTIRNIECLSSLNLTSFDINNAYIEDISFLSGMTGLKKVNISNNKITDISVLKDKELKYMWLFNNPLTDISYISDFVSYNTLETLSVMGCSITDYTAFYNFKNITDLYIGNKVSNSINQYNFTDNEMKLISRLPILKSVNGLKKFKDIIYEWKLNKIIEKI